MGWKGKRGARTMWGEARGIWNYWALLSHLLSIPWKNEVGGMFTGKDLNLKEQCHHLL